MAKKYFDREVSFYENDWLKSNIEPGKDFLHDYKGERGGRIVDTAQIKAMLQRGEIQTDASKFMDYFMSVTGHHNNAMNWKLDSYRAASLVNAMGGLSKKGEWGPIRYKNDFPEARPGAFAKDQERRLDAFAHYLTATNYEENIRELRHDVAEKDKQEAAEALRNRGAQQMAGETNQEFAEKGENANMGIGLRYKRALAGMSTANMGFLRAWKGVPASIRSALDQIRAVPRTETGYANHYAPDFNDPSNQDIPQTVYTGPEEGNWTAANLAKRRKA